MKTLITTLALCFVFAGLAQVPQPQQIGSSNSNSTGTPVPNVPNVSIASSDCLMGNCVDGLGKKQFSDHTIYGVYKNGVANGYGMQIYTSGTYEGNFENGFRNGYGLYKWNESGDLYHGTWKDGRQHGYGYVTNDSEITQAGYYENGKLITNMITDYKNNVRSGKCRGNCVNGFGAYTWDNGDYFEGFFVNSQMQHVGYYGYPDGGSYLGAYDNGKRNGFGFFRFSNKDLHMGLWKNGNQHGTAVYKYEDSGDAKAGIWEDGKYKSGL
ncbi:MORN repeat-containing protein [Constantimarinum furrinae]|uniref:hypothetical protein n=1 Tax=Constantimarinum furrinae TaxID=2562285 RepID=UPI00164B2CA4|nr:hypothetical protein [Constantimarinum furrinae]